MRPEEIEAQSFEIIEQEAGAHGLAPRKWQVVRRMIHTSADFDYLKTVRFHKEAIDAGLASIKQGKTIFTDTNMARIGIRKNDLAAYGCEVRCLMSDPDVARMAADTGSTRAKAAVDCAARMMDGGIYVVGNAPTALLRLIELIGRGRAAPALVVGLPVGFVNAAESKAALLETQIPYITNIGRKGGSNLAASVVNALIIMAASNAGEADDEKN
ncbi:MAG: precorrin-8X methylmutase [Desulfobacteraceae bacterium]|jgi:precorrin-8X/cobalt-precorrin-8 methylmutase